MNRENLICKFEKRRVNPSVNLIDDNKYIKGQGNIMYNKDYYHFIGNEIFDKFTNKFVDYKL